MKKNIILPIVGAIMFTLGFAMATGVDQNPVQAIYALACMGIACVCFSVAGDKREAASENNTETAIRHELKEAA